MDSEENNEIKVQINEMYPIFRVEFDQKEHEERAKIRNKDVFQTNTTHLMYLRNVF